MENASPHANGGTGKIEITCDCDGNLTHGSAVDISTCSTRWCCFHFIIAATCAYFQEQLVKAPREYNGEIVVRRTFFTIPADLTTA